MAYDNLHRLLSRTYPVTADNITYTYDLLGRTTATNKTGYTISYVYDNAGRLTSIQPLLVPPSLMTPTAT
ncbi:hypothetical protein [Nitrosomonas sp.]|uniref:hypothetical protein n=1 Tax=Nitrosomonas sp. TaxID=42353 RepID=UPI0025D0CBBE|nr:hypothetical protein [Nitrosomonas sp.]